MDIAKLLEMVRAYRAGAPLGDVVMMKLDALSDPSERVRAALRDLDEPAFALDLDTLRSLPDGTFGKAAATFFDANAIVPLDPSTGMRERFRCDAYALRYTLTHDLHHVLTGFDTSLAGEAGVLAFTVAQGSAPVSRAMMTVACSLYTVRAPWQASAISRNVDIGLAMGAEAELVIAAPLEQWLADPLEEVRARLHLAAPSPP